MTKKDILELKRRLKKDDVTFTKLCGCYVDSEKNSVLHLNETFLNLDEDEFFKYLEIAKKVFSGTLGNNLLELHFPLDEEMNGGKQQSFLGLKESALKSEELLESFYQSIIESYDYTGNYLILVYHDAYDVMTKTKDNNKLDESEEVYEYILCAICPVALSKPGLGYNKEENKIQARNRDWVVEAPETGFVFPAFSDRSADIHSIMYYTKNPKEPHAEFMEAGLGCPSIQTATEQKATFESIVKSAFSADEEQANNAFMDIQDALNTMVSYEEEETKEAKPPVLLTSDTIQEALTDLNLPKETSAKIEENCQKHFCDAPPVVDHLLDSKVLAASEIRKKELALISQVQTLKERLDEEVKIPSEDSKKVILKVSPEKAETITTQIVDGVKCLVIPIQEEEQTLINGVTKEF